MVMTRTPAVDLIVEDGAVRGLYAEREDGSILQVNAKAVILTSGGYANNEDTMAERGYDLTWSHNNGVEGHDGDGLRMATAAGAHDVSRERCFLREPFSFGIDFFAPMSQTIHRGGPVLWVNQDADRFMDEAVFMKNMQLQAMALKENRDSYVIFDQALVDSFCQISDSVSETLQRGLEVNEGNSVYAADSFEGLAEAFGLDADEFTATVERYNELCHAGDDVDFGKDAAYLKPIEKAPSTLAS